MAPRREFDSNAQVGIGTMIVFIATVLVAAIAAGVLIGTSADLQEKSQQTGREATSQIATNLRMESVVGTRVSTATDITELRIYVSLAPGSDQVDLSQMRLQISDGDEVVILEHASDGVADATAFAADEVRDADGSFVDDTSPVMSSGDLVKLTIDVSTALTAGDIAPRKDIDISLIPETGNSVPIGFTAPTTFGTKLIIEIA